jgi:predicted metal-dependent RNase
VQLGRHSLSFEQLLTINDHQEHLRTVDYLKHSGRPAIVIAASGMCSGGRIVNYFKALIEDPRAWIFYLLAIKPKVLSGGKVISTIPKTGMLRLITRNTQLPLVWNLSVAIRAMPIKLICCALLKGFGKSAR